MAVNGGHAGTKKGPNWGHATNHSNQDHRLLATDSKLEQSHSSRGQWRLGTRERAHSPYDRALWVKFCKEFSRVLPDCICLKCQILRSESCSTKVPRVFRIFIPNFAPTNAPSFPRIFVDFFSCFATWEAETIENSQNPLHFSRGCGAERSRSRRHKQVLNDSYHLMPWIWPGPL